MNKEQIRSVIEAQRSFFDSGATRDVDLRIAYLKKIKHESYQI